MRGENDEDLGSRHFDDVESWCSFRNWLGSLIWNFEVIKACEELKGFPNFSRQVNSYYPKPNLNDAVVMLTAL